MKNYDALVKHIRQGDSQTIRLLREAATVLGRLVASVVNVINPARIVLGGAIAAASDDLLAGVRSGVYNRAMPLATRNLTLAHSVLGPVAGVVGGAVSAIEHVLSPEGLTHADDPFLTAWLNQSAPATYRPQPFGSPTPARPSTINMSLVRDRASPIAVESVAVQLLMATHS